MKVTFDELKTWRQSWTEGSREKLTEIWNQHAGPKREPEATARLALAYCAVNGLNPQEVRVEVIPGRVYTVADMVAGKTRLARQERRY